MHYLLNIIDIICQDLVDIMCATALTSDGNEDADYEDYDHPIPVTSDQFV